MSKNESKVAVCKSCDSMVIAAHVDYLDKQIEKGFTQATNEGFIVKLETKDETRARNFGDYQKCKNGNC